jgi:hypothetical protein
MFFASAVTIYLGFVLWFGRIMENR